MRMAGRYFWMRWEKHRSPCRPSCLRVIVIQNREIQRVGSPEVRRVDVRLIAATNRDLRAEVLAGRFREDLFYRLSTIQIRVPSLTERLEDIPLLVQFFLKKYNAAYSKQIQGLSRRAQAVLLQHPWPGNVRELENVISYACLTSINEFIDVDDLPENLQKPASGATGCAGDSLAPASLWLRSGASTIFGGCSSRAKATASGPHSCVGIGRTSLYRFLKRSEKKNAGNAS